MNRLNKKNQILVNIIILIHFIYPNINSDNSSWECYSKHNSNYSNKNIQTQNTRELDKVVIRAKIWEIHRLDGSYEMTENAIENGFENLINVFKELEILIELIDIETIYSDSLYYFSYYNRPFELMQSHTVDTLVNFFYLPNIDFTEGPLNGYGQALNTPGIELFVAGTECMYIGSELVCYDLVNTFVPIHELGHCLGLLHPHNITYGVENVVRLDNISDSCEVNCEYSGDLLCDTEASNNIKNDVLYDGYNCSYELVEMDTCGYVYEPQIDNYMSYTHFGCANVFTPEQVDKMFDTIENNIVVSQTVIDIGDMNDDSDINIQDAMIIINTILSDEDISDIYFWLGDINNDAIIDVLDILLLINIILE